MKALAFLAHSPVPLGIVALAVLCFAAGPADAQIYESVDATGVRHFTNLTCTPPEAECVGAHVFVDAALSEADEGASASAEQAPSKGTAEEVPESQRSIAEAFQAGWSGGFGAGQQAAVVPPHPPVVIVPPSPPLVVVSNAPYDPAGLYYQSPYSGTIATPFDGGRSRGLTLRQQMEDRSQLW